MDRLGEGGDQMRERWQVWAYQGQRVRVAASPVMGTKAEARGWMRDHWEELWAPEVRGVGEGEAN